MICFPPLQILRRGEEARKQAAGNNQSRRIYKSLKFAVKITVFETTHKCRIILLKGQNSTCKDSAHWCKHRRTSVCSTASAKYERPAKYPLNWCRYRFSEPVTKIKVETFFLAFFCLLLCCGGLEEQLQHDCRVLHSGLSL